VYDNIRVYSPQFVDNLPQQILSSKVYFSEKKFCYVCSANFYLIRHNKYKISRERQQWKNNSAVAADFIICSLFGCEFTHFWECGERLNSIAFPIIIVEKIL